MDTKRLQELAGIIDEEYKIGDKVDIPFLNRRETGMIRKIKDDEALVLVRLQNIKGKSPINKEILVKLKDIIKLPK
jgi:hypothetical protein